MIKKKFTIICATLVFIISLLTFIFEPFTGDLHVLFAGSHQADYFGKSWIWNAFNVWDLKGEFYRLFLYVLYKLVTPITGFSNLNFEIITNLFFSIGVMVVLGIAVGIARGWRFTEKSLVIFFLSCSAIYATLPMAHMQAEMICTIYLLFAFALYINAQRTNKFTKLKIFIAGLILGSTFFYKSVIVLMAVAFTASIMLWNIKKDIKLNFTRFLWLVIGGITGLFVGCILILIVHPAEFQNMQDAAVYQGTLLSDTSVSLISIAGRFIYGIFYSSLAIPVIFLGMIAGLNNFANNIRKKEAAQIFLRIVLWGIPAFIVILANCYFTYHFVLFIFVSIIEVDIAYCNLFDELMQLQMNKKFVTGGFFIIAAYLFVKLVDKPCSVYIWLAVCALYVLITFINNLVLRKKQDDLNLFLPFLICSVVYLGYISLFSDNFATYLRLTNEMYDNNESNMPTIDKDEYVMYLDDGLGAYIVGNRTWLDEYYPLPIQRITEGSEYEDRECHTRVLNKALSYEGKYVVVYAGWIFGEDRNVALQKKIQEEYVKIGEISVYSVSAQIFSTDSKNRLKTYDIYERK